MRYDLSGDFGIGYTSKELCFYFDLEDYEKIKEHTWWIDIQGYVRTEERKNGKRVHIKMHNFVMNFKPSKNKILDHIHGNKKDNRKSELRHVTKMQNAMNSKIQTNNTSGVRGVSRAKTGLWESYIKIERKKKYLGSSENFEDAVFIRLQAEKQYFGEYSPQKHLFEQYGV